ncbi:enoyl-CoA hydratase/isomerase family protein [Actinokineospora inagensis]|uniref:enoyl-CoA hydratase/isomerase family protein n=1 Tax=Actinokineospora inagensis TaxID=103730 RepID=UPI0003FF3970|nr:enoyl-CoA hydratase/isomerase family protein [Actinokineospora inagensis]
MRGSVPGWARLSPPPVLSGDVTADAAALTGFAGETEAVLVGLPRRAQRSAAEQAVADGAFAACRGVREEFLRLHVEAVYDAVTGDRTRLVRVPELLADASIAVPGLVPTEEQLAEERANTQGHKEGREIDQGIFLRAVLRSPTAGGHLVLAMRQPTGRALDLLAGFAESGAVDLGSVRVCRRGPAGHVTLHNTDSLNAEDEAFVDDLETAVDLVLLDDRIHVGVLRGGVMTHERYAGRRVFSAGVNLRLLQRGRVSFVDFAIRRELGYTSKIVHGLPSTMGKPWVAAVDSFAIGGCLEALLGCDRVIAERDAYFAVPDGVVPAVAPFRLGRMAGGRQARRLVLSGGRIAATDPAADLVCDQVVPPEGMSEAIEAAVRELDTPAAAANRAMVAHIEEPADRFRAYLAEFAYHQAARLYGRDVIARIDREWAHRGAAIGKR